jgi:1-acyl-sn-glycerol-3-phosphate acyltransferase
LKLKKDIIYAAKLTYFTTNTVMVLNALWGTGIASKFLKIDENKKNRVYKKILDRFGTGGLVKVRTKTFIEDKSILEPDYPNVLFLANHRSMADVLAMFATAPRSVRFAAKSSLFKVPYFGQTMRYIGIFEIDRKNKKTAIETLDVAAERLKNGLNSIVMYPEGHRSKTKELLPFKKGPFHLAIKSGVPIIPVSINNSDYILPYGSWRMKDGDITLHYGKPIETKGLTKDDIPALMEEVRNAILKNLD